MPEGLAQALTDTGTTQVQAQSFKETKIRVASHPEQQPQMANSGPSICPRRNSKFCPDTQNRSFSYCTIEHTRHRPLGLFTAMISRGCGCSVAVGAACLHLCALQEAAHLISLIAFLLLPQQTVAPDCGETGSGK